MRRLLIGLVPLIAWAHEGKAPAPHDVAAAWSWDPVIIVGLLVSAFLYWRGSYRRTRTSEMGTLVLLGRVVVSCDRACFPSASQWVKRSSRRIWCSTKF